MSNYKGDKPCLGCGKSGAESERKKVGSLCFCCESDLETGRKMRRKWGAIDREEVINLRFRDVNRYLIGVKWDLDDNLKQTINGSAHLMLKAMEIEGLSQGRIVSARGVDATTCGWFRGNVQKVQWEAFESFLLVIGELLRDRLEGKESAIKDAYDAGRREGENFLLNQLKSDIIGKSQA